MPTPYNTNEFVSRETVCVHTCALMCAYESVELKDNIWKTAQYHGKARIMDARQIQFIS